jgi:hypothetical protein
MINPYEAPKSNTITNEVLDEPKKRPGWVWAISIFYGFSAIYTPVSFYLVYSGLALSAPAQKAYFVGLGIVDWAILAIGALIMLAAVVALFLLKRVSIKLWGAAIVFGILNNLYNAIAKNLFAVFNMMSLIGTAVGFILIVAIFFYTKRLDARGYLK